ncbi:MAG TPA: ATP-binding protein [Candidatus Saccharimonadales bacterium]|nr:ATP-binding protein [Candidatus Saccharimonadales bacterium]
MTIAGRVRRYLSVAAFTLVWMGALAQPALASVYGKGGYGNCGYQNCAPTSTETNTPSGLEISVNLTEGQVLPHSGYTIIVTPLNSVTAGVAFKTVDFYIDGTLVQTVIPEETGTARWFWDPQINPGTTLKVVVTGTDGSTATEEFHVTVSPAPATQGSSGGGTTTPAPKRGIPEVIVGGIIHGLQLGYNGTKRVIAALPKPLVYGFPYFLYVLLSVNLLVLFLQLKREVSEYSRMRALVARERQIGESVKTLLQLVAHYLRTPFTVLSGGVELLQAENGPLAAKLKTVIDQLRTSIERLLEQVHQDVAPVVSGTTSGGSVVWRQPGLWVPLVLSAVIVVPFNYIARDADTLNITEVNLLAQVIIYSLIALVTYQVFRRLQLHRRDTVELQRVSHEEQIASESRTSFIINAAAGLQSEVASLEQVVAALPQSKAAEFIRKGEAGFHDLITKLRVGTQLRAVDDANVPLQQVSLSTVVTEALHTLAPVITSRSITTLFQGGDTTVAVSSTELLSFVLRSLLDNAIAYSANGGAIEITGATTPTGVVITITDHGSGIPAEKTSLLFEPFSKLEGAEVFTHEGMGFSLYLDKLIMNYLGGTIALTSEPGRGTSVMLNFPLAPTPATGQSGQSQ